MFWVRISAIPIVIALASLLRLQHCLHELSQDPSNLLMVLSGQERSRMEEVFKGLPSASLAAEHGFFFKLGSFPGVRRGMTGAPVR